MQKFDKMKDVDNNRFQKKERENGMKSKRQKKTGWENVCNKISFEGKIAWAEMET